MSQILDGTGTYPAEAETVISAMQSACVDLAGVLDTALARVWLLGPGDRCSGCPMLDRCASRESCFHLVASAGLTTRVDGQFSRYPRSAPPMSLVAGSRRTLIVRDRLAQSGLADAGWFATHRIASFGVWPLGTARDCAGVLVVFSRRLLSEEDARVLETVARLASHVLDAGVAAGSSAIGSESRTSGEASGVATVRSGLPTLADTQRGAILRALRATGGRVSGRGGAAEILGLKPTTLESRIRRLGLRKPPRGLQRLR
jgi:hypothetical protein